jgi:hypothetical protein
MVMFKDILVEIIVQGVFIALEHCQLHASIGPQISKAVEILYGYGLVGTNVSLGV